MRTYHPGNNFLVRWDVAGLVLPDFLHVFSTPARVPPKQQDAQITVRM